MKNGYEVLTSNQTGVQARQAELQQFTYHVLEGLSEEPKRLSSRFIYDDIGSELFRQITDLEEYTPTASEFEIFAAHGDEIVTSMGGHPFNLVDLGAGDGRKTKKLIERARALGVPFRYVPIDISEGAMQQLVQSMGEDFPGLEIRGLVSEYFDGIAWLGKNDPERRNLVLFLGSNIGNFPRPQARAFLRRLWSVSSGRDHVLIGFDLKKDIEILLAAYNDKEGVTAKFNLNLLHRINRDLGANFAVDRFRHFSTYHVFSGAMESYLVSVDHQTVYIDALQMTVDFQPWEPIHTEYSYKFLRNDIELLARDTGYRIESSWADSNDWFIDSLWRAIKEAPPRN